MTHHLNTVALFDFDKTIVSRDSGYEFIKHRLNDNLMRKLLAYSVFPAAMLFYFPPRLRFISHSMFMWIATAGLSKKELDRARNRFLRFYCSLSGILVYQDALDRMAFHLDAGHIVYIVSGAPVWAIQKISQKIGIHQCRIIGSVERSLLGGLIYEQHCYGHRKVALIRNVLLDNPENIYGYTDSAADIPLLSVCTHRNVVNPTKTHLKKFKKAFGDNFRVMHWA